MPEQLIEYAKRLIANPYNILVFDHPLWLRPGIGDHVEIISWDEQTHAQECVRVSKLPYLTVKDVHPMVIGKDNVTGYWSYTIEVTETNLVFLQWNYKVIH